MSVSVPNTFTANTKIQSAQVVANFTAVLALTPITTLGDLVYASSSTAMARLAGNTSTTRKFLGQTGDGVNSAAPAWGTPLFTELASTTLGDLPYATTAGAGARLAGNTTATVNFLAQTGTGSVSAAPAWTAFTAPTVQKFTSTGSTTGWLFTVTSANATAGATYTNNGNTYTVLATIASGTQLFCSQATSPLTSGTLTKATGTGDATITFSVRTALATYTTPSSPRTPLYLRVRLVGGGGGGGAITTGNGQAGGISAFGPGLLVGNGGSGAAQGVSNLGAAGGSATLGGGLVGFSVTGGAGGSSFANVTATTVMAGGAGGNGFFGGAGRGGNNSVGTAGATNSGAGGGASSDGTGAGSAAGGGAGGYAEALVSAVSGTFVYCVGAGGVGGTGAGQSGSAGGDGVILVEEFYQ